MTSKGLTAKQRAANRKKIERWMKKISKIIETEIEKYNRGDFTSWPSTPKVVNGKKARKGRPK